MRRYLFLCLTLLPAFVLAQSLPSIESKTSSMEPKKGFLNYYWDQQTGQLWLEINPDSQQLLYVNSLPAALGSNDIGLDRGLLGETHVVQFERVGNKILMVEPNMTYRAITTDAAEKKAVDQSFARSTLWGFTAVAESNGKVLVNATDFLLRDAMKVANTIRRANEGNFSLENSRSAMYIPQCKNFPQNTELEASVTYVNTDGRVGNQVRSVSPTGEAITVRIHHSFVQLPDAGFETRTFDPRSSFINISYFDYSTPVTEPIDKYLIIRHRLQKKDPNAIKSEAVKPIIYYLDNGTPEPIRSALLEGASWWNEAFEAAGYINAFQVKLLPADADPMDIRYNVINWVHRSTRGWSYGASVVDPRTGEIIKGHVSLGSLRVRQDYLIATGLLAPFEKGLPADNKMLQMALNRLKQLSAHEVGHTIGLMHNYSASVVNRSSVMDYPPPVASLNSNGDIDISAAYAEGIGEWDKIAINWGYRQFEKNTDTTAALNAILTKAIKDGFQFISDRDARPAGGLHPTAHLWDNGKSPVDELKSVIKVRAKALSQFGENNIRTGTPMAMLEDVLVPMYLFHRYQVEAVTKLVGGMYYTYALKGDGQTVSRPLAKDEQVKALQAVISTLEPGFLILPEKIIRLIPPRPSGYEYNRELFNKRTGLAFDALSPAETAADLPISLLFNSERLNRLLIQGTESTSLSLKEMIDLLLKSTWKAPRKKGMEALIQLQTEQVLLTYLLGASIDEENSYGTKAILRQAIDELKTWIQSTRKAGPDDLYSGHLLLALDRINSPADAKPKKPIEMPPGAPIGCGE